MIVAVDTGGTKTLVAVFNTEGEVVAEQKFPTPPNVTDYIGQLISTIDSLITRQDISCLSIALPGTITDGVMVWAANLPWPDTDMKGLLAAEFPCPIIVENDANLAGLAEAKALHDTPPLCLYITVSTGIGTGIVLNGRIDPVLSRVEGGRILLRHNGEYKIWETFASGKAIRNKYGKLASEINDEATWRAVADSVCQGLLAILPFLKPDVVIIGGGVGAHYEKFSRFIDETLLAALHDGYKPVITKAVHPEEAVIYGCYYHALDALAA